MKDIKISKNRLGMNLYETELDCGMTFYFMPLPSKVNIRSMHLFTKFGSIDEKFVTGEDKKVVHVQDGTAHFLEHCAFYNENGKDALEEISKMGCYGNAWTNFDHTTYYIHTTNNDRQKSLEYLINFVTAPYFTEAVVKKEQGIISQEIARANDNISSILYNNLRKGLFVKHPLRKPILGNIDSIMNITTDELMFAHNTFYHPSNLRLILFIPEENVSDYILMLEKINEKFEKKGKPSYLYVDEPKEVNSKRIITEGNVAENLVALGFKGNMGDSENLLKQLQANDLLLSCLFSSTTSSVEKLIKKG
ncbi:insulinase family protein, partial [Candidatus Woesearchaeota archaeon]